MSNTSKSLSNYKENIHSQNGEDGVLREILHRFKIKTGSFVEFGAWDGKRLSNTYHLLEQGWNGVYIESDKDKYQDLVHNMKPFSKLVENINEYVEPEGVNTLDKLLASTKIQQNFEVLSIDIDSYDWHIWESLRNYNPIIVIIEFNRVIQPGIHQTHRENNMFSSKYIPIYNLGKSSFSATIKLGENKGYTLVCNIGDNLFFVKNSFSKKLQLPEIELLYPELLFDNDALIETDKQTDKQTDYLMNQITVNKKRLRVKIKRLEIIVFLLILFNIITFYYYR